MKSSKSSPELARNPNPLHEEYCTVVDMAAVLVRRGDPGLHGKNLFGQNAVNLLIGIEAGVLENDTAEIQVKGAFQQ